MKKHFFRKLGCMFAVLLILSGAVLLPDVAGGGAVYQAEAAPQKTAETSGKEPEENVSRAQVHFIDVGQGDATLILCDGHAMLIDTGDNDRGTALQLYLSKQGVKRLDYLVLTHPDADHIGGADVIITKFGIGSVFMADFKKDNKTYQKVITALADKKLKWSVPRPGRVYTLGGGKFTILAPNGTYDDPNNASIALLFQNGDTRFLFTGDAQEEAEQDILENGLSVKADVYQAGHHGSDTSSCAEFLEAVDPDYAVISCEEGNSYGHPHAAVLNSLRAMGVKVFRTDEQGTIVARSDGTKITWNSAPSDTWQAGERTGSGVQKQNAGGKTKGAYIGNKSNGKLHRSTCKKLPKEENRAVFDTKKEAVDAGYDDPCKLCKP